MHPTGDHVAAARIRGRFAPGHSGNPAGKQPGTRNRVTRLRELLTDDDIVLAVKVLMEKVRAGDGVAARFVVERLCPKMRDRELDLGLAAGTTLTQILDRALALMAAGQITIDEASRIARLIAACQAHHAAAPAPAERAVVAAPRPASDLQTQAPAAEATDPADVMAAEPRLNRHERRRAAALARAARGPTPLTAAA